MCNRRERFLHQMDRVTLWERLTKPIQPYYPQLGNGRSPKALEIMLCIHLLPQG